MITVPRVAEVALRHHAFFVRSSASGHVVAGSPDGRISLLAPDLSLAGQFDFGRKPNDVAISPRAMSWPSARTTRSRWCAAAMVVSNSACQWVQVRSTRNRDAVAWLWAAAGQDGQWIFWGHDGGDAIVIAKAEGISECIPPCFNADGTAFLIATFDSLARWSYPEVSWLGSVAEWPWSESADDSVGTSVAWAGAHRALVATNENRLFLVDLENACVVDEVVIDGHPLRPIGEVYPGLKGETGLTTDLRFFEPVKKNLMISVHGGQETSRLVLSDTTTLAQ